MSLLSLLSILVTDDSLLTSVFCKVQTEPYKGLSDDQCEAVTTNIKQNSCDAARSEKLGALNHDRVAHKNYFPREALQQNPIKLKSTVAALVH